METSSLRLPRDFQSGSRLPFPSIYQQPDEFAPALLPPPSFEPPLQLPLSRPACGDSRRSTLVVKTFVVTLLPGTVQICSSVRSYLGRRSSFDRLLPATTSVTPHILPHVSACAINSFFSCHSFWEARRYNGVGWFQTHSALVTLQRRLPLSSLVHLCRPPNVERII